MKRDVIMPARDFKSSFLSCEKDCETILRKLFLTSKPYSEELIRLLVINTKDCLENTTSKAYQEIVDSMSLSKLIDDGYIKLAPKLTRVEHGEAMSYIIVSFDNFTQSANPEFRDCTISFDVLCPVDEWHLTDFQLRPLKIIGYIDGILNKARLSGIGQLNFLSCNELLLDETIAGYTLMYEAVHHVDGDDKIDAEE